MDKAITAIIPAYKQPYALNLCIYSAINGKTDDNTEILVIIDGFKEMFTEIISFWSIHGVVFVINEENTGMSKSINKAIKHASNDIVLVVNDDNVFPYDWDTILLSHEYNDKVLSCNQIEPYQSMFKQFIIQDLGRDIDSFDILNFWKFEKRLSMSGKIDYCGSTFPFVCSKDVFKDIGGFDETYPNAWVVDWDFFYTSRKKGYKMMRSYELHFYHFVSIASRSEKDIERIRAEELKSHEHFKNKYGVYCKHNPLNNEKYI